MVDNSLIIEWSVIQTPIQITDYFSTLNTGETGDIYRQSSVKNHLVKYFK